MTKLYSKQQAQGACLQGTTFAQIFATHTALKNAPNRAFSLKNGIKTACTLALAWFAFTLNATIAHAQVNSDLSNHIYQLRNVSDGTNAIQLEFDLGNAAEQETDVFGYDLTLQFPNWSGTPDRITFDLEGAWVGEENDGSVNYVYDVQNQELRFDFQRSDAAGQTGGGTIIKINITPESGTLTEAEKAVQTGGGLIIIDDSGWKKDKNATEAALSTLDVRFYPNPASETVHLDIAGADHGTIRIYDMSGNVRSTREGLSSDLSLDALAPGLYILEVTTDDHRWRDRLIVKR